MFLHHLLILWQTWGTPVAALSSGVGGWYAKIGASKMQARRDRLDAGQQALELVRSMQAREVQQQQTITSYSRELDELRQRRWMFDTLMEQLHGQAIAARMMVHELEHRLNLPATEFAPLPPFPYSPGSEPPAATAAPVPETGASAVPAA